MQDTKRCAGSKGLKSGQIIKIEQGQLKKHLDKVVRGTVEETLNALLDAEADQLCKARRYEHTKARRDTRAGFYTRKLETKAGEVELKVPKLRTLPFETAIIERYRRRESSVEEALIEMYLAGISVRRVEDITESLWGTRVSPSTVSNLNKKVYGRIRKWLEEPITGDYVYVFLDGIWLKRSWAGEVKNVSVLVAIGVDRFGYRQVLGVKEGGISVPPATRSGWWNSASGCARMCSNPFPIGNGYSPSPNGCGPGFLMTENCWPGCHGVPGRFSANI